VVELTGTAAGLSKSIGKADGKKLIISSPGGVNSGRQAYPLILKAIHINNAYVLKRIFIG